MLGEFIKIAPLETFSLPCGKNGWKGSAAVAIKIGVFDSRFYEASSYQHMTGDCRGSSSPLGFWTDAHFPPRTFDTQALALKYAVERLIADLDQALRQLRKRDEFPSQQAEIRHQLEWLFTLIPKSGDQMDLFAA